MNPTYIWAIALFFCLLQMHQPKFVNRGEVGGIPTDPYALKGRIEQLRGLENSVPGFDAMRIFKLQ